MLCVSLPQYVHHLGGNEVMGTVLAEGKEYVGSFLESGVLVLEPGF